MKSTSAIGFGPLLLLWCSSVLGCATAHDVDVSSAAERADAVQDAGAAAKGDALSAECVKEVADAADYFPDHLRCTGLYFDFAHKKVGKDVIPYTPGVVLWSDGAEKQRFIRLPKGEKIDASNPGDWTFPVGTQFFKEFSVGSRRIETRLFQKVRDDLWARTSYQWNADETDAVSYGGGDVDIGGGQTWHIPTGRECDECHKGRADRIMGFEEVALGVEAADGLTLGQLVAQNLITPMPARAEMQIMDDGTGKAVDIVGWMHINCGVPCHNDNPNATGYSTRLRLRLSPDELDGRSAAEYTALKNTINVDATTVRWKGQKRIAPGQPDSSLLYHLVGSRAGMNDQMPPVGTKVVDQTHLDMLRDWIAAMPPAIDSDAGADAGSGKSDAGR
jgi:hypothetical protein